jgi:hypothetical protein
MNRIGLRFGKRSAKKMKIVNLKYLGHDKEVYGAWFIITKHRARRITKDKIIPGYMDKIYSQFIVEGKIGEHE